MLFTNEFFGSGLCLTKLFGVRFFYFFLFLTHLLFGLCFDSGCGGLKLLTHNHYLRWQYQFAVIVDLLMVILLLRSGGISESQYLEIGITYFAYS